MQKSKYIHFKYPLITDISLPKNVAFDDNDALLKSPKQWLQTMGKTGIVVIRLVVTKPLDFPMDSEDIRNGHYRYCYWT